MASRLETLKTRLENYYKAEDSILNGAQEYKIGSRDFRRADLNEISQMIQYLEKEIATEESKSQGKGRNRVFGVIPRDF
ncbi:hypothetical protein D2A34_21845 [Clostridium chromiireducens]|uniref:Uncharacterized protein n=1 Tax=Clostridium chromiireducens TaxID=225345 RepID=A0A399IN22_9CLOT|nr:DUF6148 family protein [Clostridium chromiireducens]RII32842.1 hypothetical protein D2A34_21845 [Clostridium chromiireducens]